VKEQNVEISKDVSGRADVELDLGDLGDDSVFGIQASECFVQEGANDL